jgi:plasmid maintenance system antidote protein VapI
VKERRGITADTAERLARHFGGDAASWLAPQADDDLKTLATRDDIARKVSPRQDAPAQIAMVVAGFACLPAPVGLD